MPNFSTIDVAILAGGLGTRIKKVVRGKPKVLAEVYNQPFLKYLLHQLEGAKFQKVILCSGYLHDQVKKTFAEQHNNIKLFYSHEQSPLGTGGALRKSLPLFKTETILVMNGDSFCEVDFAKFWEFHQSKKSNVSLVLTKVSDTSHFGKVALRKDNSIIKFEEKISGSGAGFINAGVYLINKKLIAEIPENKNISLEKDIFPKWIGKDFYGYKATKNNFIDIGTPESYQKAQEFFADFKL